MKHVANKVKMTLAALVCACMMLTGVPAVAFAAAGEAASDAVGSLGDAIESLAADAGENPAITPLADEEPDYNVTTVVFELTSESYLKPQLYFSKRDSSIEVDWGDGTTSTVSSATGSTSTTKSDAYDTTGTYIVTISSEGSYWLGGGSSSSTFIASNYRSRATSIIAASNAVPREYSFYGLTSLTSIDLSACDTSEVTNMSYMFYSCSGLTKLDLSGFDTSNVTNMGYMFDGCSGLTELDVTGFDTTKVTTTTYMFYGCSGLTELDLSGFYTSNVTSMNYMFCKCSGLTELDISGFDTSKVTNMGGLFGGCSGLSELDVTGFDTSKVTGMGSMFDGCSGLTELNVSGFDTSKVTGMSRMFDGCSGVTELDVSDFDTSKVTSMSSMFASCSGFTTLDLSGFDTSLVTNMSGMLNNCTNLTEINLSGFDTSNVEGESTNSGGMSSMFNGCKSLTSLDLTSFDTSKVTTMYEMFYGCSALTSLDLSGFDTSNVTTMYCMFRECSTLTSLDLSGFDTSKVTNMYWMFEKCSALHSLDLSSFDTSKVTNMSGMFWSCTKLTELDLSSFDTSSATNMRYMFNSCSALTSLDMSGFDTSKVTDMSRMFNSCSSLTVLDLSGFDTSSVTSMDSTFSGCTALREITLGDAFSFCGVNDPDGDRLCNLPNPSSSVGYTTTGSWVDISDSSKVYAYNEVPNDIAATYYAQAAESSLPLMFGDKAFDVAGTAGFTGTEIVPSITTGLLEGTEYTVSYDPAEGWNIGNTVTLTITGVGNYESDANVLTSYVTLEKATPPITTPTLLQTTYGDTLADVKLPEEELGTWSWDDGDTQSVGDAGVHYFGATFTPNDTEHYESITESLKVTVWRMPVEENMFTVDTDEETYTGASITKAIESDLTEDTDYRVRYSANTKVGTAGITIQGIGNYRGEALHYDFTIAQRTLAKADFSVGETEATYTGSAITRGVFPTGYLQEGRDYTVACTDGEGQETDDPTDAGTYTITVTADGTNCSGSLTYSYTILPKALEEGMFTVDTSDADYTGAAITKEISGSYNEMELVEGTDYTVGYAGNTDAGTATITIAAVESSNYSGSLTESFQIKARELAKSDFDVFVATNDSEGGYTYDGTADAWSVTSKLESLEENRDYTVTCTDASGQAVTDAVDAGTYTITIKAAEGQSNCVDATEGPLTYEFKIKQRVLSKDDFTVDESSVAYTGNAVTRSVSVNKENCSLQEGDYSVTYGYTEAINAGTYTITVTTVDGGNCKNPEVGPLTYSFTITQCELSSSVFYLDAESRTYTGADRKTVVKVTRSYNFVEGSDYTVSYLDASGHEIDEFINAGDYIVRVSAVGPNCTGSVDFDFTVSQCTISNATFTYDPSSSVEYTGAPITKEISGTYNGMELIEGTDYTVAYENNVDYGNHTASITIEGIGNYSGTRTHYFSITAHTLSAEDFTVDTSTKTYTGAAITKKITPTGSFVEDRDYFVTYESNTEVGTATITIAGDGTNCRGNLEYHFTITSNYLTSSSFKVDTSNATYTGSAITKKITPADSLVEGRDYTVSYANNVSIGTATITITGMNNCIGQVTYTFKIVKPAAKLHAQSIKLAKKKVKVKRGGKKVKVKVKGAKTSLVAKPKGKKAKKALKVKVKGKKKLIVRAKPNAKRGTYKVKVYAKQAGSYAKSKTVKLKVKVK